MIRYTIMLCMLYLVGLYAIFWKGGAMKFAGRHLRHCQNPACDAMTTHKQEIVVQGRRMFIFCCQGCKPIVNGTDISWEKKPWGQW